MDSNTTQLLISLSTGIVGLLIVVGVFVLILLITRELTAWYFKTNEIIKLLKEIRDNGETDE
jgi:hypothetical protein